jgi:hypothetical protein
MKIMLKPGEALDIGFYETGDTRDYELDGKITVVFVPETAIRVIADMPDTTGRTGIVYEELFGDAAASHERAKVAAAAVEETRKLAEQELAGPKPTFDPNMYRRTAEQKAFGDKLVAENIRFHFADKLDDYTDAQVADAYERAMDRQFSDNFEDDGARLWFRNLLSKIYDVGEPAAGEHQEVLDAIEAHNSGEE